jgi:hypothetical protein
MPDETVDPLERWSEVTEWEGEIACSVEEITTPEDPLGLCDATQTVTHVYQASIRLEGSLPGWNGDGSCSASCSESLSVDGPGPGQWARQTIVGSGGA